MERITQIPLVGKFGIGILAASLYLTGGMGAKTAYENRESLMQGVSASDTIPSVPAEPACGTPSNTTVETIRTMLAQPGDPVYRHDLPEDIQDSQEFIAEHSRKIAQNDGVSIVDTSEVTRQLNAWMGAVDGPSFDEALADTNKALLPFGIDVSLEKSKYPSKETFVTTPSSEDLKHAAGLHALAEITEFFDDKPRNFANVLDVDHIVIYKGLPGNTAAGYVLNSERFNTVHLEIGAADEDTVAHEFGHGADRVLSQQNGCGSIFNDPGFAKINGISEFYNGVTYDQRYLNLENHYQNLKDDNQYDTTQAFKNSDKEAYCEAQTDLVELGQIIHSVRNYHPFVSEDKASVFAYLFQPDHYDKILDPNLKTINAQAELLLSRMFELDPNLTSYLIHSSKRPVSNTPIVSC